MSLERDRGASSALRYRGSARRLVLLGAAIAALLAPILASRLAASEPPSEPVTTIDGRPYVSASALARLLQATRFWRADVRKLVLRTGSHRLVLTVDNPFVLVDNRTVLLPAPVRSLRGELHVPLALADSLPHDATLARLVFEPRSNRLVVLPPGGLVSGPQIAPSEALTRVAFRCELPELVQVVGKSRANFQLRFEGFFAGLLPDTVPPPSLVRAIHELPTATGSSLELRIAPEAAGWRLTRERDRVVLEVSRREAASFEGFAPEEPPGPRGLRVIVLDPGHGGPDSGVVAGALVEKDLTLALARALKPELERRLGARVLLTRETDVSLAADARAEAANRARADLVISLHFDGLPGSAARGVTAYAPPATFGGGGPAAPPGMPTPVEILPWRDVATRHAVRSREIAQALLNTLELRGLGPARLREVLPAPLLGVNAPGLLLECATLTSSQDLDRLRGPRGVAELAAAIAEGVESWKKGP